MIQNNKKYSAASYWVGSFAIGYHLPTRVGWIDFEVLDNFTI